MNEATRLAAELRSLAKLADGPLLKKAMTRVGVESKEDVDEVVERDLGSDGTFSGWKRIGRLKSGFEQPTDSRLVLTPRPAGGWQVAEQGRMGGSKAPKAQGAKRRLRTTTFATPWGPRTYSSAKPLYIGRTRGKRTWTRSVELIEKRSVERGVEVLTEQIVRHLGG